MTLEDIKKAAEKDKFPKQMKKQVWLIEKQKKGSSISPCSISEQVLLYADRVVMPYTLQKEILKEFHIGNPGMTRMKSSMRSYTY